MRIVVVFIVANVIAWVVSTQWYESMSCSNMGKTHKYPTRYVLFKGCFTQRGTHLPAIHHSFPAGNSVATSLEAHTIMRKERP